MTKLRNKQLFKSKQTGATFVELIFIIPLFFFLVAGIIEVSYVYRTKSTLNVATFEAAREGAVTHVSKSKMRHSLAAGMIPVFVKSKTGVGDLAKALAEAKAFEQGISAAGVNVDSLTIVSPNKSVFSRFKEEVAYYDENASEIKRVTAIPNDNLTFRPTTLRSVNVSGQSVQMNIQDANLLKIKTVWCHQLKVPVIRDLVKRTILNPLVFTQTNEQLTCSVMDNFPNQEGVYVALTSQAITRIQSHIYNDELE